MKIEVGDVVLLRSEALYAVVRKVSADGGSVHGYWCFTELEALAHADDIGGDWALISRVDVIRKRQDLRHWTTTGTCTCSSRDLFAHGCKCGAIVRYADRAMA